jgi:hypothetical protein
MQYTLASLRSHCYISCLIPGEKIKLVVVLEMPYFLLNVCASLFLYMLISPVEEP